MKEMHGCQGMDFISCFLFTHSIILKGIIICNMSSHHMR